MVVCFHCHLFVFRGCKLFFVWQTNPRWKLLFFRPQLSAISSLAPENDGSFYMPWEDFATIYDTITICPVLWRHSEISFSKLPEMCSFNNQTPKCVVMPPYPTSNPLQKMGSFMGPAGPIFGGPMSLGVPGKSPFIHYTGWLIGILIMVYDNPYITG